MKKLLKRSMALILALICAMSLGVTSFAMTDIAMPTSGTCGAEGKNLKWSYDAGTSTLTIKGNGKMADYGSYTSNAPWNELDIKSVVIKDGVTYIGSYAFAGVGDLKDFTFPSSVTAIGELAFARFKKCDWVHLTGDLKDWCEIEKQSNPCQEGAMLYLGKEKKPLPNRVVIPEGTKKIERSTFAQMAGIQEVIIPEGVREIGYAAFEGCTSLKKITMPASLKKIQNSAFNFCWNINEIRFGGTLKDWCSIAVGNESATPIICFKNEGYLYINGAKVEGEIIIPEGTREIKDYAFKNYHAITGVKIPDGVSRIGKQSFCGCKNLENVEISGTVAEVGEEAFFNSFDLDTIVISQGIKKIGSKAFYGANTTTLYLPKSVEEIGHGAFGGLSYLEAIHYAGTQEDFGNIYIEGGNERLSMEELMHYGSWVALTDPSYVAVMPDWAKEPIEEEIWYEEEAEADTDAITEEFADGTEYDENANLEKNEENDTKVIIIVAVSVAGVLIAAAAIVTVVILKKKKNS